MLLNKRIHPDYIKPSRLFQLTKERMLIYEYYMYCTIFNILDDFIKELG